MDTHAVKEASFAGDLAAKGLAFDQPAAADADVVAPGHGKRVEEIARARARRLERQAQPGEDRLEPIAQGVQPAAEAAFVAHLWHQSGLLECDAGPLQIGAEEERRNQGGGDNFGVAHLSAAVFLPVHGLEQVIDEHENGGGLFDHPST